jgi:hypothetical protein
MPTVTCAVCSHSFEATDPDTCPNCGAEIVSSEETTVPTGSAMGQPFAGGAVGKETAGTAARGGSEPGERAEGAASASDAGGAAGAGGSGSAPGAPGPPPAPGAGGPGPGGPGGRGSIPFEDRSQPFFTRLFATIGLAFRDPRTLFSGMPQDDMGPAMLFFVLVTSVSEVIALFWWMVLGLFATVAEGEGLGGLLASGVGFMFLVVLVPVFALVALFIQTAIYHVCLLVVGDGQRGFGVTLRAVAYGASPGLLVIVPICGGIVAGVWIIVLSIMGACYGHRTDGWRAVVAYFLPNILCCCVLMLFLWFLGGLGVLGSLADR